MRLDKTEAAIKVKERLAALEPNDHLHQMQLGGLSASAERYDKALECRSVQ